MSDRGWGDSCGGDGDKRLTPQCANGYNHLMDTHYEVRDAQDLAGLLVDDGIVDPTRSRRPAAPTAAGCRWRWRR